MKAKERKTVARPKKITYSHLVSLGSRLTDRDRQIAVDCYDHHVLTTEQILRLHFDGKRAATARLDILYQLRVLDRFRPSVPMGEGTAPYHWVLDEAGAHIVAACRDIERRQLRWRHTDSMGVAYSGKLRHHTEINEFFSLLALEAEAEHGRLAEWYGERTTQRLFKGIAPDGYGVITMPDRPPVHVLLELDRATEPAKRLRQKAVRYAREIYRSELAQRDAFVVLAVPSASRARLANKAVHGTGAPIVVAEWSKGGTHSPLQIVTQAAADRIASRCLAQAMGVARHEAVRATPTVLPSRHASAPCCQALEIEARVWSDRHEQPCAMRAGHTQPQHSAGRAIVPRRPQAVTPARPTATSPGDAPTLGASPALAEAARLVREAVRDKSYQLTPIGTDAAGYLRAKRKRLTDSSYRDYECCLDKLARHFLDLRIEDFEPPSGTERIEEFLDALWGSGAPRTYNKNLSIIKDFFRFQIMRGRLHGDPTLMIERARSRQVYRTTFSADQRRAIVTEQPDLRDRLCLRLLLDYGLRKGALQAVQFKHFDHQRRRLTIFTKGQKVRELPLPHRAFWHDLEHHILDVGAQPSHYLLCTQRTIPRVGVRRYPEKPMSGHAAHDWWYRCLTTAGIVAPGTTSGERMHKSRHTAGQRVLDRTGNLKAVQKLLGHASIQTTGDIYADWDIDQLAATMADVLADEDEDTPNSPDSQSFPPSPPQKPTICSGNEDSVETAGIEPASAVA